MGKFTIGDKVRIKQKKEIDRIEEKRIGPTPGFTVDMHDYCNKEATVIRITTNGYLRLDVDDDEYAWCEDWLEFAGAKRKGEKTDMRLNIDDVKIVVPNKVVEVTFEDQTKEKAVCAEEDTFSLDTAITICIAKHMLGGSSAYNNAVRKANKILVNKAKAAEKAKAEAEQKQKRVAKFEAYKKRKVEKKREQEIELRKEAYKRAIMELNGEKAEVSCQ